MAFQLKTKQWNDLAMRRTSGKALTWATLRTFRQTPHAPVPPKSRNGQRADGAQTPARATTGDKSCDICHAIRRVIREAFLQHTKT